MTPEPYALQPQPTPPKLPGKVVMAPTPDELIDVIAADLMAHAINCVRTFGDFHIALSGGSTPFPLYERLMIDPMYRELPWRRTHLWIVDERRVPFDHEKSNWRQINEIIVEHSGIPAEQVHPMRVMEPDCDVQYEKELRATLGWRERGQDRLDFALLGMGDDGHTASLFPHSPALSGVAPGDGKTPRFVLINSGPKVTPPDRVTMTYHLLNAARFIAVLTVGQKKQPMLRRVAAAAGGVGVGSAGPETPADLPILGIKPLAGELRWYVDYAAAGGA